MSSTILKNVSIFFSFNRVSSKSNLKYADNSRAMKTNIVDEPAIQ